jgi:hypothetical protein
VRRPKRGWLGIDWHDPLAVCLVIVFSPMLLTLWIGDAVLNRLDRRKFKRKPSPQWEYAS